MIKDCPFCYGTSDFYIAVGEPNDSYYREYLKCNNCGLIFYDCFDSYFSLDHYNTYYINKDRKKEKRILENDICYLKNQVPVLSNIKTSLDIGGGFGDFSYFIKKYLDTEKSTVFDAFGVGECNEYDNIEYVNGEFPIEYPNRKRFDLVVCNNLLEHTNKPIQFIERLISLSNRYIYITTPNSDTINDNKNWKYFYYPEHLLFINQKFIDYIKIKYGLVTMFKQTRNKDLIVLFQLS